MFEIKLWKVCPQCNRDKNTSKFNKSKTRKDGLSFYCKECCKKHYRKWATPENRKKRNEKVRKSYAKNKDKINKRRRELRKQNPEKYRQHERKYRKENVEKKRKWGRENYQRHKKDFLRRAKERKKKIIEKHIRILGGKCMICGYNKYVGVLELHHLMEKDSYYDRYKSKLNYSNFMLLCANCHRELHGRRE